MRKKKTNERNKETQSRTTHNTVTNTQRDANISNNKEQQHTFFVNLLLTSNKKQTFKTDQGFFWMKLGEVNKQLSNFPFILQ
jgi:methionine salvage enolase-phosphatase E1